MNTNNTFESKKESVSHNFQDSNLKVNRSNDSSTSALISKGEISSKTNNSIEESGLECPLPKSNNTAPRLKVSVDFAASQWFQILLININNRNKKIDGVLESFPGATCV